MSFQTVLVYPIVNVLLLIYKLFSGIGLPYALGFSIIGITILIRFVLYPFISSQVKASKKMQEIAPHLSKLKEKYKKDPKKLQQETLKIYKEYGVNPAAGCLPVLIQLPIIWALYSMLQLVVGLKPDMIVSEVNKIAYSDFLKISSAWDTTFFGIPLGPTPGALLNEVGFLILLVPVITGALQYIQSKMLIVKQDNVDKKKNDFATAFQSQSLYIFPVMIGFFSYSLPFGLSLYWNTFTIFGIIQQYKIAGLGGLASWFKKNDKKSK